MAGHCVIGPSSLPRTSNCVGSLYGPPVVDEAGPAAVEGTTCHAVLEFCLAFGENPRNLLGSTEFSKDFPVTIEMVEAVELFIDTIKGLCAELNIPLDRIRSEQKMIHPQIPDGMFGGTTDCQAVGDTVLVTADLKFGRRPVFADSLQLTAYSLLALGNLPTEQSSKITRVVQVIVQPRCSPQVSRHEPGSDELAEAWTSICRVAQFILDHPNMYEPQPDALVAGEWCKYCKRREGCVAREALVTEAVEFGTFVNPNDMSRLTTPTHDVTTEVLLKWHNLADVIKEFLADTEKALKVRAAQGQTIPGWKLTPSYGNRSFVGDLDDAKLEKKLTRALGLTTKDVRNTKVKSPKQIEDTLKELGKYNEVKEKFEKLTESKLTGVKLVPASKKGEEILPEAALEFLKTLEANDE